MDEDHGVSQVRGPDETRSSPRRSQLASAVGAVALAPAGPHGSPSPVEVVLDEPALHAAELGEVALLLVRLVAVLLEGVLALLGGAADGRPEQIRAGLARLTKPVEDRVAVDRLLLLLLV